MLKKYLKSLAERWDDWVGDRDLQLAINRELRRQELAVHASRVRRVRLVAIQRPGWLTVHSFFVETVDSEKQPVTLEGIARNDGRSQGIEVLLTDDPALLAEKLGVWTEGLIVRRR